MGRKQPRGINTRSPGGLFSKTFGIKSGSIVTLYCNSLTEKILESEKDPEEERNIRTPNKNTDTHLLVPSVI